MSRRPSRPEAHSVSDEADETPSPPSQHGGSAAAEFSTGVQGGIRLKDADGADISGSADDHQIMAILAHMSQQQSASKPSSHLPSCVLPSSPSSAPTNATTARPHRLPNPSPSHSPSRLASPTPAASTSTTFPPRAAPSSRAPPLAAAKYRARAGIKEPVSVGTSKEGTPVETKGKGVASGEASGEGEEADRTRKGKEEEWSRTRKDNHKEVERRRRETINEGINELKKIVPGCEKNKGSILQRAVQYIQQLKDAEASNIEKWTLEKLLSDQAMAEVRHELEGYKGHVDVIEVENEELRDENDKLREALLEGGRAKVGEGGTMEVERKRTAEQDGERGEKRARVG